MGPKKVLSAFFSIFIFSGLFAQDECNKTLEESLREISNNLYKDSSFNLWKVYLNADIIFISTSQNKMFFTSIQNGEVGKIEEDSWDNKVGLANTATVYNDKKYVTILYDNFIDRSCERQNMLLTHEIFHYHQKELGFPAASSSNYHLDSPIGRALLHMEFDALEKALLGSKSAVADALYIRKYRQSLYPSNNEKLFLANKGIELFFNPNDRIISIGESAVLFKNVTLKAEWGELRGEKGIIRMNDWSAFILQPPTEINDSIIKGNDYIIDINPDWHIVKKDNICQIEKKD